MYSITNLMVLILYHKYLYFLYKFSQSFDCLTYQKAWIVFFCGRGSSKLVYVHDVGRLIQQLVCVDGELGHYTGKELARSM